MPGWDKKAPLPQIFSDSVNTYVIYAVDLKIAESLEHQTIEPVGNGRKQLIALTEFKGGTFRFGLANDALFGGLPYDFDEVHWAHKVINSKWIAELKNIHKLHNKSESSFWDDRHHLVLLFKAQLLEIIYIDYKTDIYFSNFEGVGREVLKRINKVSESLFVDTYS
jgi:hypothetical protein